MLKVEAVLIPRSPLHWLLIVASLGVTGCPEQPIAPPDSAATAPQAPITAEPDPGIEAPVVDTRPPPMARPVPFWSDGDGSEQVDAAEARANGHLLLDLGEEWTPYLFTEVERAGDEPVPNAYRETYLALARGDFPDDWHGERARRDKYLELYGIMPTLRLIRQRMRQARENDCFAEIDTSALAAHDSVVVYRSPQRARRDARRFRVLSRQVEALVTTAGVDAESDLELDGLSERGAARLREYRDLAPTILAVRATQQILRCEGFFEGKATPITDGFDWVTHQALAEFERKDRIYGWGFLGPDTRAALQLTPAALEREAVIRVLTERAMHEAGVIEDGSMSTLSSGEPRTFIGADGEPHPIPNLEADLRARIIAAFGLATPESTAEWLDGLGPLDAGEPLWVAIDAPELPEYYSANMEISVSIDRGDVWYDFPYDNEGRELPQPTRRRPRETIYVTYQGHRIPLARYGTTIGGWRTESVDGTLMWSYKESPVGPRVWTQIVASPVWMPPDSTPVRSLLHRRPRGVGAERYEVNYYETGPSYASAYGLVAAYHRKFRRRADGTIAIGGDEGIRNHGSVDYMSIMRRHSHGCHRLHNHIAVRLMSFVLDHRPHHRQGQQRIAFHKELEYEDHVYNLDLEVGGYIFTLDEPLPVEVLEGRIRGHLQTPIEHPMPKYDSDRGGYWTPDGQHVSVSSDGTLTPLAPLDGGALGPNGVLLDGGVFAPMPGAPPVTSVQTAPGVPTARTPLGEIVLPPAATP